ncbi:MAG: methyl-accepting chemotaxis protein, partial [Caulobacter sp.]|nr:methyl-accepting chemotaxis protein [Caulobacter sp.]
MKLDDLRIATKVFLPAAVLAIGILACTGLGMRQQKAIETATQDLVEHRSPAEVQSARFSRRLSMMGYAAHRIVTYDGASEAAQSASKELDKVYGEGKDSLDKMNAADPGTVAKTDPFRVRLDAIYADARRAADLGLQNDDVGATGVLTGVDPALDGLSKEMKAWGDTYHEETAALVAVAEKQARAGALLTLLFGLGCAAAGLGFSLWIGSFKISRPVTALAKTMTALARGEVDQTVVGAGRQDEVGLMARAVQVFKDNAVALRAAQAEQARIAGMSDAERTRNEAARETAARDQAFVMERVAAGLTCLAQGDLTFRVDEAFPEGYGQLRDDFNAAMDQLDAAMGAILGAVGGIGAHADEITAAADDSARRSEQQAASLE